MHNENSFTSSPRLVETRGYRIPEFIDGKSKSAWNAPYIISETFIEKMRLDPETLLFYQMPDDSMFQRIRRGDIALLDTADTILRDGEKFVIRHRAGARLRRVFIQMDGSLLLSPDVDGPQYRPEHVPENVAATMDIVGRVVLIVSFSG
jgi:hypothetical protein